MNNRALIKTRKHVVLTATAALAAVFAVVYAALFFMIKVARDQNYNCGYTTASGWVDKASTDEDSDVWFLYLADDDRRFCTTPVEGLCDWTKLEGEYVEIYIPSRQIVVSPPLILGLSVNGETIIDPSETAERMRSDRSELVPLMAVTLIAAAVSCAAFVWRLYVPKYKVISRAHAIAIWNASVTPKYTSARFAIALVALWSGIFLLCSAIADEVPQSMKFVFALIVVAAAVVGAVATFLMQKLAKQKINEFFIKNFPFSDDDLSHLHLTKKVRKQIEQTNREFNEKHPHTFGDSGNGVWAEFGETGVDLFYELEDRSQQSQKEEYIFEETSASEQIEPFLHLSYEQLNFEAVAFLHLTSENAIVAVVKSRFRDVDAVTQIWTAERHFADDDLVAGKLTTDLHFVLDANLLDTLRKFNVPVENLNYIMQNFAELIVNNKKPSTYPENFDESGKRL